jgi:hypothetical protein
MKIKDLKALLDGMPGNADFGIYIQPSTVWYDVVPFRHIRTELVLGAREQRKGALMPLDAATMMSPDPNRTGPFGPEVG